MDFLQVIRLWATLERCAANVRHVHDDAGTALSVTSSGPQTLALSWRSSDPLTVRVTVLAGLGCTSAVTSRDALRAAARSGLGRYCRLAIGDTTLQPTRRQVRRLLAATDAVVPAGGEAALVDAAAESFVTALLDPSRR